MSAAAASSKPSAELGWRPTEAKTSSAPSAAAIASRFVASSRPTVRIRRTPTARAAATRSASSGSQNARWAWVSTTSGLQLREQGRQLLGRCAPAPAAELGDLPALLPERAQQPLGGLGHIGKEEEGDYPEALGEVVEDQVQLPGLALVLGQVPRPALLDVAVEAADQLPDLVQRLADLCLVQQLPHPVRGAVEVGAQRRIDVGLGDGARAVALDHRQGAAGEVAVVVRQLGF